MVQIYGLHEFVELEKAEIGGKCPHCKQHSRFSENMLPRLPELREQGIQQFVVGYSCDACLGPVPIVWHFVDPTRGQLVHRPTLVIRVREDFDFEYVPDAVAKEVQEALDCYSVGAYNGFAAMCRRATQAICTELGAEASTKVQKQIDEMMDISNLDQEWRDLAHEVMKTGHDGSHPHLPEVNRERADVLFQLLQDLTHQLFTRPGKIRHATSLREDAIKKR